MVVVRQAHAGATAAAIKHGERAVEALQHHFRGIAVLAVLALPFARLQLAFDVNLGALFQILLGHPAQPFVEDHHGVPLRLFATLAGRLVAPGFGRCNPQVGDRAAVLRAADLGILAEIANQDDFVDGSGHVTLLFKPLGPRCSRPGGAARGRANLPITITALGLLHAVSKLLVHVIQRASLTRPNSAGPVSRPSQQAQSAGPVRRLVSTGVGGPA